MTLNPKITRGFVAGTLLVVGILMALATLLIVISAISTAAMEAEKARNIIKDTHKTCVKYADSEIVTGSQKVRKAEIFRCPEGRLVVVQD